jgi:hypothetical protein
MRPRKASVMSPVRWAVLIKLTQIRVPVFHDIGQSLLSATSCNGKVDRGRVRKTFALKICENGCGE